MPKQSKHESISSKWDQLRQYEDQEDDIVMEKDTEGSTEAVTAKIRMKQLKESSSRTFFSLKNQVSGFYR
jgi:translation initiation factor IF-2